MGLGARRRAGQRGVDEATATLAADVGVAVFRIAFQRWLDGSDDQDLTALFRESLDELGNLASASARLSSGAER